jgi:hypothetical protein
MARPRVKLLLLLLLLLLFLLQQCRLFDPPPIIPKTSVSFSKFTGSYISLCYENEKEVSESLTR